MDYEKEYIDLKIKYDRLEQEKQKVDRRNGWFIAAIFLLVVSLIVQDRVLDIAKHNAYDEGYEQGYEDAE